VNSININKIKFGQQPFMCIPSTNKYQILSNFIW